MKNQIGKFRPKKTSFTAMSNHVLLDQNLDMSTKALHAMINYFLTIPNFTLYKAHVQSKTNLGDKAFNRMWRQLKNAGYLLQHKLKDERGTFYYEYELLDQPLSPEAPLDDKGVPESAPAATASINKTLENNTLKNKTLSNKTIKKQQQDQKEPVVATIHAPSRLDQEILDTYQKAFNQLPNAMVEERLLGYLQRFEKDVVLLALEMAGAKQKSIDYAYGILRVWAYEGAYNFDDVVQYEECYR